MFHRVVYSTIVFSLVTNYFFQNEPPYKRAVIFVDNAGVDFVLGVLPLVRELLKANTEQIVITGNSAPALNDITWTEICSCLLTAGSLCPIIKESLASNRILTVENGQKGPCLDLSNLDHSKDLIST